MESHKNWEVVSGVAKPELRSVVSGYAGFSEQLPCPVRRLELPSTSVKLIVCIDGTVEISETGFSNRRNFTALAVGFTNGPVISKHTGKLNCIEINLSPLTASALLSETPSLAGEGIVDLCDLWGDGVLDLVDELRNTIGWTDRFDIVDQFIVNRFKNRLRPVPKEVSFAWNQIMSSAGQIGIGKLACDVGWSARHLSARFREVIGENPKAAARRIRISKAQNLLNSRADYSLNDIAFASGYSDQSHLTREFREFAGVTPGLYRRGVSEDVLGICADRLGL